ncbi:hypothetical protein ACOSQ4_007282 [Xanthoceras sorbifolium]
MSTTDVELLKTASRNEKAAPEILQFQAQLVKRAREQIQLMEDTMEEFEQSDLIFGFGSRRCIDDIEKHLEETVLSKLPDNYQSARRQSIISEEDDMVPEPQLDTFVACKSSNTFVSLRLVDSERPLEMERHDASFVLYKVIKENIGVDIDLV